MAKLERDELTKVLEKILESLNQQEMLKGVNKVQLIEQVIDNLEQNNIELTKENVQDKAVLKTLALCLVGQFVNNKFNNNDPKKVPLFDYTKIFEVELTPKERKELLMKEIKNLLMAMNKKLDPADQLQPQQIDDLSLEIAEKLDKFEKDLGEENDLAIRPLANTMSLLSALYGGIDLSKEGGIQGVVQSIPEGNVMGFINYNPGGEEATSYMAEKNTVNVGTVDASGTENTTKLYALSKGGFLESIVEQIEQEFSPNAAPSAPTPFDFSKGPQKK